jgi:hypothetical protein
LWATVNQLTDPSACNAFSNVPGIRRLKEDEALIGSEIILLFGNAVEKLNEDFKAFETTPRNENGDAVTPFVVGGMNIAPKPTTNKNKRSEITPQMCMALYRFE